MENTSTALLSVIALTVLTACGGGGPADGEALAAAPAPQAAGQGGTVLARESAAMKLLTAAGAVPAADPGAVADSGPAVDPLVANRVQEAGKFLTQLVPLV